MVLREIFDASSIQAGLNTAFIGRDMVFLESTTSTMDEAKLRARQGAPEGMLVVADEQRAGRGRFQRRWVSPKGTSLLISLVLRPALQDLPRLNMVASLSVVRAIEELTPLRPRIKWPNDVLLEGLKACGILVDSEMGREGKGHAVLGIGLNVNLDPYAYPEIAWLASSISSALGRPVSRVDMLCLLLKRFEELYMRLKKGESLLEEWRRYLETLGKAVTVTRGDIVIEEGYAQDVDEDGHLILRRPDGSLAVLVAGEVSLKRG